MEVGILTMHRVMNYGSFMQAYALKSVIESFGHHVTFRDFRNGEPRHLGRKVVKPSILGKIARLPSVLSNPRETLRKRAFRHAYRQCFKKICWPLLEVPSKPDYSLKADVMVIGSDEVFNYTQNHAFGYVPCLFGHGIEAPAILSYAASAGYANWGDVVSDNMQEEIGSGLRRMKYISVRDENTRLLVEHCAGISPTLVIDPTLIYDFDNQTPQQRVIPGKYLLVYAYEGRMNSEREVSSIRSFAAKHGLKIVSTGAYHEWCDDNIVVSPFELLRVFQDAAYVVTDTFHGSIFAMKQGKQFATFVRSDNPLGSNANKVFYLLHQFGMESRIVNDPDKLGEVLAEPVPCDVFNERLAPLRQASMEFLKRALS